ncbi:histidine phosphatase family protein [Devosia sp.]|uniref:histidine phosphatase family protein n=1 Tax=Devosia sp. TaxID=1871048 RepID=UPI003A95007F
MSRLFIVRHGNTFQPGEAPRRIGARTDLPLTATGRTQAEALGAHFVAQGIRFSTVLAGALQRTQQTATLILGAQCAPPPIATATFLTEIDHGPDENQTEDLVLERIGAEALASWDRAAVPPAGWNVDPEQRIAAWRDFAADADGDILLVTSNGAARFALLGLVAPELRPTAIKLRTGAYGLITGDSSGRYRLSDWDKRPG